MKIYWVNTTGWVTEKELLLMFIGSMELNKEYQVFKSAMVEKTENVS